MKLGQAQAGAFLRVAEGDSRLVSGVVEEVSAAPRPGKVAYADHVIYMHLVDVKPMDGRPLQGADALVAGYSMRGNVWTRLPRLRTGARVTLRLRNYDEVNRAEKVESINSSLLESDAALETPCWGEELAPAAAAEGGPAPLGLPEAAAALIVALLVAAVLRFAERREGREPHAHAQS